MRGRGDVSLRSASAAEAFAMSRMRSINVRFSGVFVFVLVVVVVLGLFSAWRLSDYRTYAGELRDRFFRSTQYIGDLNNYTSDFRAGEGDAILTVRRDLSADNAASLKQLDNLVTLAQHSYEHVPHDRGELALYAQFRRDWTSYRRIADTVLADASDGRRGQATALYLTSSRVAYDAASDALGRLTELNLADANLATREADAAYQQARLTTILAMLFAGLMIVGGFVHVRRLVADPLVELASTMHALAANVMDVQIRGAERKDEIGDMARAVLVFRKNAVDLALSQATLAEQAATLSEKLAAEQRLTQLQRNFLSMASHEFRTPLTVIDGQAQRLTSARGRDSPADVAERAGKIRSAVLRITSVIERLIDAARLADSDEGLVFHPTELDLSAVLREVCRQYREIVPSAFIWEDFADAPLIMRGDRRLLQDLFSNLVSNAVKYSVDAIQLRVRAYADDGEIVVQVSDRGVGIPAGDLDRLFERYFRGGNVSAIVGAGIGLYLVKMVVDLHGGSISVQSEEHKGSVFTVRLPRTAQAAKAAAA
jgi:signal transduction histidine kinase